MIKRNLIPVILITSCMAVICFILLTYYQEDTEFEELKNSINTIANKLARIDIEGIMGKVSDLIDSTNKKVDSIDFEMVNYAMASITDVLSFDSSTRQSLDKFLQQGSKMMRSLRVFLDYLERNPNAMIAGKAL